MRKVLLIPLVLLGGLVAMGTAQAAPPGDGDRIALVIGIDRFQGATRPNLGAVGDAEDVRDLLLRNGWRSENIRMLIDGGATAGAIRDGLSWLASESSDNSFAAFHYSGHVKQTGSTEYLWPHDNQFISDTDVASSLRNVKGYLWADFSGCEAAGFDEGISGPKRLVTAASQSWEKGYELPAELRNSVFTNLMVDKAMLQKQGDANRDGKVSLQEAFRHAADRAPGLTADQSFGPQHPYIAGGDGDEWFLGRARKSYTGPPAKNCFLIFCS